MDSNYTTGDDIFECQQCGSCCKGFGGTYVTPENIHEIAAYINCDTEKFIQNYCDKSGSKYVLTSGSDGYCIFFDRIRQCTIHDVKPFMCRTWPFIQGVIDFPENWEIMSGSCPGMKKEVPHKKIVQIAEIEKKRISS